MQPLSLSLDGQIDTRLKFSIHVLHADAAFFCTEHRGDALFR